MAAQSGKKVVLWVQKTSGNLLDATDRSESLIAPANESKHSTFHYRFDLNSYERSERLQNVRLVLFLLHA